MIRLDQQHTIWGMITKRTEKATSALDARNTSLKWSDGWKQFRHSQQVHPSYVCWRPPWIGWFWLDGQQHAPEVSDATGNVELARHDQEIWIAFATSSLAQFAACLRQGHLDQALCIFGYLKRRNKRCIVVNLRDPIFQGQEEALNSSKLTKLQDKYPDAFK